MLSAFFGIQHGSEVQAFLDKNFGFYTADHQQAIRTIERDSGVVREFAQTHKIWDEFAKAVKALAAQRYYHVVQVDDYLRHSGGLGAGKGFLVQIAKDTRDAADHPSMRPEKVDPVVLSEAVEKGK